MSIATVQGKKYSYLSFSTKSILDWNYLRDLWYPLGKKIIPDNIHDLLTPIALAYWLMGDGGWTNNGIHLATHSFPEADVLRLVEVFTIKYGLKCSVHSGNRIYIWTGSVPSFINIVWSYLWRTKLTNPTLNPLNNHSFHYNPLYLYINIGTHVSLWLNIDIYTKGGGDISLM